MANDEFGIRRMPRGEGAVVLKRKPYTMMIHRHQPQNDIHVRGVSTYVHPCIARIVRRISVREWIRYFLIRLDFLIFRLCKWSIVTYTYWLNYKIYGLYLILVNMPFKARDWKQVTSLFKRIQRNRMFYTSYSVFYIFHLKYSNHKYTTIRLLKNKIIE